MLFTKERFLYATLRRFETPCLLSTSAESTSESSPVKIWSIKSLPCEKHLEFYLPDNITLLTSPRIKYEIIDSPQVIFKFHPDKF